MCTENGPGRACSRVSAQPNPDPVPGPKRQGPLRSSQVWAAVSWCSRETSSPTSIEPAHWWYGASLGD